LEVNIRDGGKRVEDAAKKAQAEKRGKPFNPECAGKKRRGDKKRDRDEQGKDQTVA